MISYLKGKVKLKNEYLILDVNGVGYQVSPPVFYFNSLKEGEVKEFFVHLQVREDSFNLYGFLTISELDFFKQLIKISDVGPKSALGLLSLASLNEVKEIIANGDVARLSSVPGVGKKTAGKIILELKEKIKNEGFADGAKKSGLAIEDEVVDALVNMGYKEKEINKALVGFSFKTTDTVGKIKEALKELGRK